MRLIACCFVLACGSPPRPSAPQARPPEPPSAISIVCEASFASGAADVEHGQQRLDRVTAYREARSREREDVRAIYAELDAAPPAERGARLRALARAAGIARCREADAFDFPDALLSEIDRALDDPRAIDGDTTAILASGLASAGELRPALEAAAAHPDVPLYVRGAWASSADGTLATLVRVRAERESGASHLNVSLTDEGVVLSIGGAYLQPGCSESSPNRAVAVPVESAPLFACLTAIARRNIRLTHAWIDAVPSVPVGQLVWMIRALSTQPIHRGLAAAIALDQMS